MASDLPYLRAYPVALQEQARDLLEQGQLANVLLRKYPQPHSVRSDKALYDYVQELKTRYLRNAGTVNKVLFDNKIHVVRNALGLHTAVSRVQGSRLAAKHEIRIASMFKQAPDEFLRMIVVHKLLIRPCEVLSRVANVTILEVANNALRVLLQHRHVIIGSLA